VSATLQAASIVSLGLFTGTITRLSRRRSRRLQLAAAASGSAAAVALTVSAATHAALTRHTDRDDNAIVSEATRAFVAGGPVHGVAFGAFIAAMTLAADGLLRRPGRALGMLSAAAGIASPLYFRWRNAGWLIPIGRFTGYGLTAVVGSRLAHSDARETTRRHSTLSARLSPAAQPADLPLY
jgi:hypothetical protein